MSDTLHSEVTETHGNVHAGEGHQYIYNLTSLVSDEQGRDPRRQAADELRWLHQHFIAPPGFGDARRLLEAHRTVFLDAPPGSGRTTAARMLLWEFRTDTQGFHELLLQDKDQRRWIDLAHVGDGDRLWLDLSDVEEASWAGVHSELSGLRETVHERSARLVVVLPDRPADLRPELDQYRVIIARPPLKDILQRHLRRQGFAEDVSKLAAGFPGGERPLDRIPRFVRLVVDARAAAPRHDFSHWVDQALQALSGQAATVATLFRNLEQGQEQRRGTQRALLLATAMLHGAHADAVHEASASLLESAAHPPDEEPMLARAPLDVRLDEIDAELDAAGRVRFRKLDYDSAVRAYCWTHLPELRTPITEWVKEIVTSSVLDDNERNAVVERFSRQCLNERHRSSLVWLVNQWTAAPASARRLRAAALVLLQGLRDHEHGRYFRSQIYEWSRASLSRPLRELIVAVCRHEMAVSHPDQAVVRLHHLARREGERRAARQALSELVREDRRFLRHMIQRLTDTSEGRRLREVDADLFLALTEPDLLIDPGRVGRPLLAQASVRDELRKGWSFAFTVRSEESWGPRAGRWLTTAATSGDRDGLLDVIIAGGERRTAVLARLYAMSRGPDLPPSLGDLVRRKIDAAQGIPCG
ncbi:hypothetical protein [Spirillospora sp. NPDC047279]|uniref:hypothetical protein n=1 Tax=Spirillospora sp. NPDC047279 TaxID=3155478 RepID=UPI0033CE788B